MKHRPTQTYEKVNCSNVWPKLWSISMSAVVDDQIPQGLLHVSYKSSYILNKFCFKNIIHDPTMISQTSCELHLGSYNET